jgi:glycosyltransferase involved in cell wall biosynthesis
VVRDLLAQTWWSGERLLNCQVFYGNENEGTPNRRYRRFFINFMGVFLIFPKISVIIPVKNDDRKIGNAIEGVLNQTIPPFEIIVVDGHSTDNTMTNASKYPVSVIFEDFGTVGGARQVGVENAKGEYIAFTDSDCIPEKNWLENLLKELGDDIVGVGGGIKNIGSGIWEESIALALDTFLGSANSVQDRVLKKRQFVPSISGCNSMYRRKDLLDIGGFNVTYTLNEDTDINMRLKKNGKILYTPEAIVSHNQERSLRQFCKRMFSFGYGRGNKRLIDLQIIPPIALVFVVASIFLNPLIFFPLIVVYLLIVLLFSMKIVFETKKVNYFFTVPLVFLLEHSCYSAGFWWGLLRSIGGDKK